MKTISAPLQTHIQRTITTLCTCWRIVRLDGQEFFFTNLDIDIEFPISSGDIYKASSGMSKSNLVTDSAFGVNNADIEGVFDDIGLTTSDLQNGLFNYATVFQFMVNYEDLSQGELKLTKSTFGEVTLNDVGVFIVEQRGMTQVLKQQNIVEVYNAECPADLGDVRCALDLGPFTIAATILSVTNNRKFKVTQLTPASTFPAGWFDGGAITWLTGLNTGKVIEVKIYTKDDGITIEQELELFLATSFDIQIGDTLNIYPGCDKILATCRDKFNNIDNFRGFPHIPGPSFIPSQIPSAKT